MTSFIPVMIVVALFLFPIYWLIGGVFFAAVTFVRSLKLRRVRFSTYFSLLSLLTAFGASFAGLRFSIDNGTACLSQTPAFVDMLSGVVGCGILEFVAAGVLGFVVLLVLGSLLLVLSRASNQSWVDSDMGLDEEAEITFENL